MTVADVPVHEGGPSLLCDTSSLNPRPIEPPGYRRHVFDLLHGLSHPSSRASKELICSRYVWHGMKKDITHWCNKCLSCQALKNQRYYRAPVEAIPVSPRRNPPDKTPWTKPPGQNPPDKTPWTKPPRQTNYNSILNYYYRINLQTLQIMLSSVNDPIIL